MARTIVKTDSQLWDFGMADREERWSGWFKEHPLRADFWRLLPCLPGVEDGVTILVTDEDTLEGDGGQKAVFAGR